MVSKDSVRLKFLLTIVAFHRKGCTYSLFKDTPSEIWRDSESKKDTSCLCPAAPESPAKEED